MPLCDHDDDNEDDDDHDIYKTRSLGAPYFLLEALRASLLRPSRPAGVHVTHADGLDTQANALDG